MQSDCHVKVAQTRFLPLVKIKVDKRLLRKCYSECHGLKYLLLDLRIHYKIAKTSSASYWGSMSRCAHVVFMKLNYFTGMQVISEGTSVTEMVTALRQWDENMLDCCMGGVWLLNGNCTWTVKCPTNRGDLSTILYRGSRSYLPVENIVCDLTCS